MKTVTPFPWTREEILQHFTVSPEGSVTRNSTGLTLKTFYSTNGEERIVLQVSGKRFTCFVSRLVAYIHIPNPDPENLLFVVHRNGDRGDNRAINLKWVSQRGIYEHQQALGRMTHAAKGVRNHNSAFTAEQVQIIRNTPYTRGLYQSLAREYSVTPPTIRRLYLNRTYQNEARGVIYED